MVNIEDELQRIDAEMTGLGRPPFRYEQLVKPALAREHAAKVAAWRAAEPAKAVAWDERNARCADLQAQLERQKWAGADRAQAFERLVQAGVPRVCVDVARKPSVTAAMEVAREWWPSPDWSLVLLGGWGAGKTSAAAWLALEAITDGRRLRWLRAPEACRHPLFGEEAEAWTARARTADLLVLDDLGADVVTDHWRGWLEDVLDARWGNHRRTVVTVNNLDLDGFKARVGPRLGDRLKTGRVYDCGAVSLRTRRSA